MSTGTEGQDRESYTDTQDRESYAVSHTTNLCEFCKDPLEKNETQAEHNVYCPEHPCVDCEDNPDKCPGCKYI